MKKIFQKSTLTTLIIVLVGLISTLSPDLVNAKSTGSAETHSSVEETIDSKNNIYDFIKSKVDTAIINMNDVSDSSVEETIDSKISIYDFCKSKVDTAIINIKGVSDSSGEETIDSKNNIYDFFKSKIDKTIIEMKGVSDSK